MNKSGGDSLLSSNQVSGLTGGLSLKQVEEILMVAEKSESVLDEDYILAKKKLIFDQEYSDVLEFIDAKRGFDAIGGLNYLKNELILDVKNMKKGQSNVVPMGIILMGPPGTGKSAIAEALAKDGGVSCVMLKNVRHWLVGRSEANYYKALEGIKSLSPVIVIEDEADQSEQSRDEYSGDSGVSNRMRQARFEFTSDPDIRGKVLWVKITNRPDKIDPADKRSGRADKRIPILLPNSEQKEAIFRIMPRRNNFTCKMNDYSGLVSYLEELCVYISGADIEEIMRNSLVIANKKSRNIVEEQDIKEAIEDFMPSADEELIDKMTYVSIKSCSSKRLLPSNVGQILQDLKDKYGQLEYLDVIRQI